MLCILCSEIEDRQAVGTKSNALIIPIVYMEWLLQISFLIFLVDGRTEGTSLVTVKYLSKKSVRTETAVANCKMRRCQIVSNERGPKDFYMVFGITVVHSRLGKSESKEENKASLMLNK